MKKNNGQAAEPASLLRVKLFRLIYLGITVFIGSPLLPVFFLTSKDLNTIPFNNTDLFISVFFFILFSAWCVLPNLAFFFIIPLLKSRYMAIVPAVLSVCTQIMVHLIIFLPPESYKEDGFIYAYSPLFTSFIMAAGYLLVKLALYLKKIEDEAANRRFL